MKIKEHIITHSDWGPRSQSVHALQGCTSTQKHEQKLFDRHVYKVTLKHRPQKSYAKFQNPIQNTSPLSGQKSPCVEERVGPRGFIF